MELKSSFQRDDDLWSFPYHGTQFFSFDLSWKVPTKSELDGILNTLESLKPEMRSSLQKILSDWNGAKLDDGESYSVNVQDFASEETFTVTWLDRKSWGDLGVDFLIKSGTIIDETLGD